MGHQSHGVAQLLQPPCPVVRAGAGFHADHAQGQLGEELDELRVLDLTTEDAPATFSMPAARMSAMASMPAPGAITSTKQVAKK